MLQSQSPGAVVSNAAHQAALKSAPGLSGDSDLNRFRAVNLLIAMMHSSSVL